MKRIFFAFMALLSMVSFANERDNGFVIDSWEYTAQVHANHTWDVTEVLQVNFLEERHGIYRYIPRDFVRYHRIDDEELKFDYHTRVEDVTVEDCTFETHSADDGQDNLVIRMGDEDHMIIGKHTYKIHYKVVYPDDRYEEGDELFHTLLGADVPTPVGKFKYQVSFDKDLPYPFQLNVTSGAWGRDGNVLNVTPLVAGNTISGVVEHIQPFNAITLQAQLPEGFWESPYRVSSVPVRVAMVFAIAFFLLTFFMLLFRKRVRPTVVTEYTAPEGISSAEVGVIIDDSADLSDLTSLIVWFASKGYLKIREIPGEKTLMGSSENDIELVKLQDLPKDAPKYQKLFWKALFQKGDTVTLSKLGDCHTLIANALLALAKSFTGERKLVSVRWRCLGFAFLFLLAAAAAFITSGSVQTCSSGMAFCGFAMYIVILPLMAVIRMALSNYDMIRSFSWRLWQFLVWMVLAAGNSLVLYLIYNKTDYFLPFSNLLALCLGGWVLLLFCGRMLQDTPYRLEKMSLLLGFKEFIKVSELPMLRAQVDENPTYFFDVLPYAMVFGLTDKWHEKFKDIEMKAPDWYESCNPQCAIMPYLLAQQLTYHAQHGMQSAIQISSRDPNVGSSSGGSSRGFAGGGGGGGGVGSW